MKCEIYSGAISDVREKVNKFLSKGIAVFQTHVTSIGNTFIITIFYYDKITVAEPIALDAVQKAAASLKRNPGEELAKALTEIKIPDIEIPNIMEQSSEKVGML